MAENVDEKNAAMQKLLAAIYVPTFIKRCAERGLNIENEQQLATCLDIGAMLNIVETKKASAGGKNLLTAARDQLGAFMKQAGLIDEGKPAEEIPSEIRAALDTVTK